MLVRHQTLWQKARKWELGGEADKGGKETIFMEICDKLR